MSDTEILQKLRSLYKQLEAEYENEKIYLIDSMVGTDQEKNNADNRLMNCKNRIKLLKEEINKTLFEDATAA